jgi:uncharacterized protein YndB with AHSA1/START domain
MRSCRELSLYLYKCLLISFDRCISLQENIVKIDILRYIGAVTREVETRDLDGRPVRVAIVSCAYDTDIHDLWDAITNAQRIPRWFLPISGDLRLGGRYQLRGNAGGQITACEPPSRFAVTWEFADQVSWVHVGLTELSDGGTRLQLEHIAHVPDEFWSRYGPGAVGVGWDLAIMGLGRHFSTGSAVDATEAASWLASQEGKDFVRESSNQWSQASVAAGANESDAVAAANRTTAFYTGGS